MDLLFLVHLVPSPSNELQFLGCFVIYFHYFLYICGDRLIPLSTKTYFCADLLVFIFVIFQHFCALICCFRYSCYFCHLKDFFLFVILAIACICGHKCSSCVSSKSCACASSLSLFCRSPKIRDNAQSIKLGYFKCNISLPHLTP